MPRLPIIFSIIALLPIAALAQNRVLSLDGDGDYAELPAAAFATLDESTVEFWVRWDALNYFSQPFGYGSGEDWRVIAINNRENGATLQFFTYALSGSPDLHVISAPDFLQIGVWYHLAAVSGADGMRLFVNGVQLGFDPYPASFSALGPNGQAWLGRSHWRDNADFNGQLDEVRIWRTARTPEQIRTAMQTRLRGNEADLVALWNFDHADGDDPSTLRDASPLGHHGRLRGDARRLAADLPTVVIRPAVIAGRVIDRHGRSSRSTLVRLKQEGRQVADTPTDTRGRYRLVAMPGVYDLVADWGELGAWELDLRLHPGQRRAVDLDLRSAVSLEGVLQSFDADRPHSSVLVEAVDLDAEPNAPPSRTLSDRRGHYRFLNLRPGSYRIACHIPDSSLYASEAVEVAPGKIGRVDFRFAYPGKGTWKAYTFLAGMAGNKVNAILEDTSGVLWVGTEAGLSRFDGTHFTNFTRDHGLNQVRALCVDPGGTLWAGLRGVSRYDGQRFTHFTSDHGLPDGRVLALEVDRNGTLWAGTDTGLAHYDGSQWMPISQDSGLAAVEVTRLSRDSQGDLWAGTWGRLGLLTSM